MGKRKFNITMEKMKEMFVEIREIKQFIEEHLGQKCFKENISVEGVSYISLTSFK